jgi:hypothetical protein
MFYFTIIIKGNKNILSDKSLKSIVIAKSLRLYNFCVQSLYSYSKTVQSELSIYQAQCSDWQLYFEYPKMLSL